MLKKTLIIIYSILTLTSCASGESKSENSSESSAVESNTDNSISVVLPDDTLGSDESVPTDYIPEEPVKVIGSDNQKGVTVDLLIPVNDMSVIDSKLVTMLNDKLEKDGHDFSVCFHLVNELALSPIDYYEEHLNDENKIDIILTGAGVPEDIAAEWGIPSHTNTYKECINKGYLTPLNDYFKTKHGEKLYNSFDKKYWDQLSDADGKIYGAYPGILANVPLTISFDIDVSKKLGFSADSFDGSLKSLETYLKKLKETEDIPGLIYASEKRELQSYIGYSYQFDGVLEGIFINEKSGKAENIFESEEFIDFAKAVKTWKDKGYMGLMDEFDYEKHKAFASLWAFDTPLTASEQEEAVIGNSYYRSTALNCAIGISESSEHKDEAFKLLALLFSDKDYAQLICCGDTPVLNGTISFDKGCTGFYTGLDISNTPANPFIIPPVTIYNSNEMIIWKEYSDKQERLNTLYNYIQPSAVSGIDISDAELAKKISNVAKINDEYYGLFYGEFDDVEATLKKVNQKLKDSGIDSMNEEINRRIAEKNAGR